MVKSWFILPENSRFFNRFNIAQLVECQTGNQEIRGSNPATGNSFFNWRQNLSKSPSGPKTCPQLLPKWNLSGPKSCPPLLTKCNQRTRIRPGKSKYGGRTRKTWLEKYVMSQAGMIVYLSFSRLIVQTENWAKTKFSTCTRWSYRWEMRKFLLTKYFGFWQRRQRYHRL